MIFKLFRGSANKAVIGRLYADIVAASRQPALFSAFGIPDTFEGRFESLTLHAALVLRRLNGLQKPGPEMAQDLVDAVFRHFDSTLREMGVGDTTVPKRMKRLAEAFLGRSSAYDEALRAGHDALTQTLQRNVLANLDGANAAKTVTPFVLYVEAAVTALADAPLEAFMEAKVPFPDPARFLSEAS